MSHLWLLSFDTTRKKIIFLSHVSRSIWAPLQGWGDGGGAGLATSTATAWPLPSDCHLAKANEPSDGALSSQASE